MESETADSVSEMVQTHIIKPENITTAKKFNCEQNLDDDLDYTFVNVSGSNSVGNRFGDFEEACIASKRFIVPGLLNNIYNQLTPVYNSVTFVQKIQISECR